MELEGVESCAADESVSLSVHGVTTGAVILVRLEMDDTAGRTFSSSTSFEVTESDVTESTVVLVLDGLIEAAEFHVDGRRDFFRRSDESDTVTVTVECAGEVATHQLTRWWRGPGVRTIDFFEPGLTGRMFLPAEDSLTDRRGVVLVGGSDGGFAMLAPDAARLASYGIAAMSLALFAAGPTPQRLIEVPLEGIATACRRLALESGIAESNISVLGLSRGSEAVLSAAAHLEGFLPEFVVTVSPSSHTWEGFSGAHPFGSAAWTVNGRALPWVGWDAAGITLEAEGTRLCGAYELVLAGDHTESARIPVEGIQSRIVFIVPDADSVWPSVAMTATMVERRRTANRFDDIVVPLLGAGHLPLWPMAPVSSQSIAGVALGGSPTESAIASRRYSDTLLHVFRSEDRKRQWQS